LAKPTTSRLKDKVALVTGANRGIGLAIARALASEGCNLVVTARDPAGLNLAGRELKRSGREVLTVSCDVRDPEDVRRLLIETKKQFRRIDILVNNAGVGHSNRSVEQLSYDAWRVVIDTNLNGLFLVTHFALPLMKRGGAIVNNLSIAAKRVFPGSSAYNASKHGALGLTDTLREELRPKGIRVIALLPGATDTAIWQTLWPGAPRKKMMSAETVARAAVDALCLPPGSTLEELVLRPSAGTL
jgi:NAD(P)-dependent dehydrogenase (short-subunit alcohol dehydrogenase family)